MNYTRGRNHCTDENLKIFETHNANEFRHNKRNNDKKRNQLRKCEAKKTNNHELIMKRRTV